MREKSTEEVVTIRKNPGYFPSSSPVPFDECWIVEIDLQKQFFAVMVTIHRAAL